VSFGQFCQLTIVRRALVAITLFAQAGIISDEQCFSDLLLSGISGCAAGMPIGELAKRLDAIKSYICMMARRHMSRIASSRLVRI